MVEPKKLRDGIDPAARLLRAGMRDAPSPSAKRAVGRALGVSFAVVSSAATAKASAGLVQAAAKGSVVKLGFGSVAKWCAIGFAAGSVATAVVAVPTMRSQSHESLPPPPVTLSSSASAVRSIPLPTGSADERSDHAGPVLSLSPAPVDERRAAASPRRGADMTGTPTPPVTPQPAPEPVPSLSREVEVLERVRQRLRAGDPAGALSELDRAQPGVVSLAIEAELLRVEALLANGERERAKALAFELVRRYPEGPLNFRLKRLFSTQ